MADAEAPRTALTRSGVKYPAMVAEGDSEDALKFNCTQRSHQNTLEQLPTFLAMQLLLAQAYPLTAAALGMIWNVGTPERPLEKHFPVSMYEIQTRCKCNETHAVNVM